MEAEGVSGRRLRGSSLCNRRLSLLRYAKSSPCAKALGQLAQLWVALFRDGYWPLAGRSCRDRRMDERKDRELQPAVEGCLASSCRFVAPAAILSVRAGHIGAGLRSPPNSLI